MYLFIVDTLYTKLCVPFHLRTIPVCICLPPLHASYLSLNGSFLWSLSLIKSPTIAPYPTALTHFIFSPNTLIFPFMFLWRVMLPWRAVNLVIWTFKTQPPLQGSVAETFSQFHDFSALAFVSDPLWSCWYMYSLVFRQDLMRHFYVHFGAQLFCGSVFQDFSFDTPLSNKPPDLSSNTLQMELCCFAKWSNRLLYDC